MAVGHHMNVYVLDVFGTLIFSLYGAYIALEKGLKLQMVVLAASCTAVGGGTLRCAITHTLNASQNQALPGPQVLLSSYVSLCAEMKNT